MLFSEGVKPDPQKVKDLADLQPPKNKEELKLLKYIMQSNNDFISIFLEISCTLRILLNSKECYN